MKIIEPSVFLVGGNVGLMDRARHVEKCGRVCYKSEKKITENSAEKFIAGIIKSKHEAVLEHARITLHLNNYLEVYRLIANVVQDMENHGIIPYMTLTNFDGEMIVSGNIRAWRNLCFTMRNKGYSFPSVIKRMWMENAPFFPEFFNPDEPYIKDPITDINPQPDMPTFAESPDLRLRHSWYTFRVVCDRGVSHEIVRHRPMSFCQESTRYCNYKKGQFGSEITVIKPCFWEEGSEAYELWKETCGVAETAYLELIESGKSAQEARSVLPNSLKMEIVMTATADEWLHFINLRSRGTTGAPHPQMLEVATQIEKILLEEDAEVFGNAEG